MNIKVMRNIHLYLGCFFAPLLILFIITGSWQMYDKHRDAKDGSYHAPAVVKALSNVHMEQSVGDRRSGAKSSEPFKYLIVLMGFGLLVTTILGIVMAFKYVAPRIVWLCLVLGILIPLLLLWCGGAFAEDKAPVLQTTTVTIPGGQGGVGFDDLNFSSSLGKVIVPAGRTGKVILIDPSNYTQTSIVGFSSSDTYEKGHGIGVTSVDEGEGFLFVTDHGAHTLNVVDVNTATIVAKAALASNSDYVRYVESKHEVWVTEPDQERIEVFTFLEKAKPVLKHTKFITVFGGPESLVVDNKQHRAYTHLWIGSTVVIDLNTHTVLTKWSNGCEGSRGIALDKERNFLFVGCSEGKAVVLDINQNGKKLSSFSVGPGVDVISYNAKLSHLYFTGSQNATVSILRVSDQGVLSLLGVGQAAKRAHCVVGDDQDNIWVCDPEHGQLLRYKDSFNSVR